MGQGYSTIKWESQDLKSRQGLALAPICCIAYFTYTAFFEDIEITLSVEGSKGQMVQMTGHELQSEPGSRIEVISYIRMKIITLGIFSIMLSMLHSTLFWRFFIITVPPFSVHCYYFQYFFLPINYCFILLPPLLNPTHSFS